MYGDLHKKSSQTVMKGLFQSGMLVLFLGFVACKAVPDANGDETPVIAMDSTFIPTLTLLSDSNEGITGFERFGSVAFAVIGNSENYFVYGSFLHGNGTFLSKYRVDKGAFCIENKQEHIGYVNDNGMNTYVRLINRIPESMLDCQNATTCNVCMSCAQNSIVYFAYTNWDLTNDCPNRVNRQFYLDLNSDHLTPEQRSFAIEIIKGIAVLDYCQVVSR